MWVCLKWKELDSMLVSAGRIDSGFDFCEEIIKAIICDDILPGIHFV